MKAGEVQMRPEGGSCRSDATALYRWSSRQSGFRSLKGVNACDAFATSVLLFLKCADTLSSMNRVIYPGTFDPPTNGHVDIIHRAARLFDHLEIVISVNPQKQTVFTPEERHEMMESLVSGLGNVSVHTWEGLIVDFAEKVGAHIIVRGVRALSDFDYEFELALMQRALNHHIETIFLPTSPEHFVLRSSAIKEIAHFGGDVRTMVPEVVVRALEGKLAELDRSGQLR